ncbi:BTAD domain-containing putative transcriptional regulator [Actinosynnema sp. NPDC050436]|uniref:AfsR/SARP family transcriptional regulator n=1 Tax=Actinosynnema sp. NPDC050436 TaxID=3155659 RepID=UPI0033E4840F
MHRFRLLVGRSHAEDDDGRALHLVQQAVDLPRSPALGGWAEAVRRSLDRERWAALLHRNDITLRLDRHEPLIAGSAAAAEDDPLDERLAGQLVLAEELDNAHDEAQVTRLLPGRLDLHGADHQQAVAHRARHRVRRAPLDSGSPMTAAESSHLLVRHLGRLIAAAPGPDIDVRGRRAHRNATGRARITMRHP